MMPPTPSTDSRRFATSRGLHAAWAQPSMLGRDVALMRRPMRFQEPRTRPVEESIDTNGRPDVGRERPGRLAGAETDLRAPAPVLNGLTVFDSHDLQRLALDNLARGSMSAPPEASNRPVWATDQILDDDVEAEASAPGSGDHGGEPLRAVDRCAAKALVIVVVGGDRGFEAREVAGGEYGDHRPHDLGGALF